MPTLTIHTRVAANVPDGEAQTRPEPYPVDLHPTTAWLARLFGPMKAVVCGDVETEKRVRSEIRARSDVRLAPRSETARLDPESYDD